MISIAISIDTPHGARLLAASSEREAALMAESVIATLTRVALPTAVTIQCRDPGLADRLMAYLADVQMELVLAEVA